MDKFLIKRPRSVKSSQASGGEKKQDIKFNVNDIVSDPGLRKPIEEFDIAIRDQVRREYLTRGPCQPVGHNYPQTLFGQKNKNFRDAWFEKFDWLEYSISKDAAFCFSCYLFKSVHRGDVTFTIKGFNNWKKALEKFNDHVGCPSSCHNDARLQLEGFKNQRQSVSHMLASHGQEMEIAYRTRLTAALDVTRLLLKQGLSFRGHDESLTSLKRGNFLEFFEWYSLRNNEVRDVVNDNAPGNNQMTSPKIQKELINACAAETTLAILNDIGDNVFSIMVDESRDVSIKEQMAVVFKYVNKHGHVVERFIAMVHVVDTSSVSLKNAIDELFAKHNLSLSRLRGQGYDGASNMRGEFNGLKALILKENPSARYVHCFAHQLQLVVVVVAKTNRIVSDFFQYVTMIVNVAGASCKRKDKLRQLEHDRMVECLESGEIVSGKGKNQETSLARPGDTRWGSHYITLVRLMYMWTSVLKVLENVFGDGTSDDNNGIASSLIDKMESYEFVFVMYLMKYILGITNDLSHALQEKDQNIVKAVNLIEVMKIRLKECKNTLWDNHLKEVNAFCEKNMIPIVNMDENVKKRGHSRRNGEVITNFHHFRVEIFCQVFDLIQREMEDRFSESSTELLKCISCLDPRNGYSRFDKVKLLRLAEFYPEDFSFTDRVILEDQLENYICDVKHDFEFSGIEDFASLAKKMVETGKNTTFTLVYRLIELYLVLPVVTATVERVFSAMKIVKTDLRNKMGDEWMNDNLVVYIEKDVFATIENEQILQRFQAMHTRMIQLSSLSHTTKSIVSSSNK